MPQVPSSSISLSSAAVERSAEVPSLTSEQKLDLLYYMKLNRLLEERLANLYRQGKVAGGLYRSLGQEATSVGSAYALGPDDFLAPLIRNLGSVLVRGVPARDIFMQTMARGGSPTGGKDCNLHFGDIDGLHLISSISMLGALIPVMAGMALAAKMKGLKLCTLTYIGDGGTSTGDFHEGLNFAAVQNVPMILIAENNLWAYSTPISKQMRIHDIADRGPAYGIPAEIVDGNDVEAVYAATFRARQRALSGGGPTLVESKTMRMKGHAEHDGASYVPKEMFDDWSAKDPIARYETLLVARRDFTAADIEALHARIERELDAELAWAEASPMPAGVDALDGVYADERIVRSSLPRDFEREILPVPADQTVAGKR